MLFLAYILHMEATPMDTWYIHIMMTKYIYIYIYNCLNSDLPENRETYLISSMFRNKIILSHVGWYT
jgi:hypothetical protein